MKNLFIPWVLSLFLYSCATTHPGTMATGISETNADLLVSVHKDTSLSDEHYSFLEFTIENTGNNWKQLHVTNLGYGKDKSDILKSKKLAAWLEGSELKLRKKRYNTSLLLGSIGAVGAGVTAFFTQPNCPNCRSSHNGRSGWCGCRHADIPSTKKEQCRLKGKAIQYGDEPNSPKPYSGTSLYSSRFVYKKMGGYRSSQ